jgi:hypothetical protein
VHEQVKGQLMVVAACISLSRIRRKTARNSERSRSEQGSVRNTVIEPDWLNMLVDRGKNRVVSFEMTK